MKKKLAFVGIAIALGLALVFPATAFATHNPAPDFPHPGKDTRCAATNPHNVPGAEDLPNYESLHDVWHLHCTHD